MIVLLMIAVMIILSVIIASNKKNKMSFNSNFLFFIHYKTFHPNEYLVNEPDGSWNFRGSLKILKRCGLRKEKVDSSISYLER